MKELTRAEEQIMQILWELKKAYVKEIVKEFPDPKPAYNTVSTIVRILEKKKFISYEAFGKTFRYYPLVSKEAYAKQRISSLLGNYFDGSLSNMISFFTSTRKVSVKELDATLQLLKKAKSKTK